jgi:hypothetical protein
MNGRRLSAKRICRVIAAGKAWSADGECIQARGDFGANALSVAKASCRSAVGRARSTRQASGAGKMVVYLAARCQPREPNEVCSLYFMDDQLSNSQNFRALTVVDIFSREDLVIEVGQRLPSKHVVEVLNCPVRKRGAPNYWLADNGA